MQRENRLSKAQLGFTLVELLVALVIMALLALLSWRGLDGMTRVYSQTQANTDGVLALQAGLAQWQTDLDAINEQSNVPGVAGIDYDGQVLRITRSYREPGIAQSSNTTNTANNVSNINKVGSDSLRVVAWTQRNVTAGNSNNSQWLRWQSDPVNSRADLLAAWIQAKRWASEATENDKKNEVVVANINAWQVFYYRKDAWTNALSSADVDVLIPGTATPATPDGVRLVLTLSAGQALTGVINRDWVSPKVGGGKG